MTADLDVQYGAHLPLIDLGTSRSLPALKAYARAAAGLGYRYLCANDHLRFSRPWLDGPTALAALVEESRDMTLATTASLPVLRGPVQLAKTLAAIDILSGGAWSSGWARDRRRATTPPSAFGSRSDGDASTRPCRRCAACSTMMGLASRASSTPPAMSCSSRGRCNSPGHRSGSRAGARRRGFGGSLALAMDGLPLPTTPRPIASARAWTGLPASFGSSASRRDRSRARSPRPGCSSPRTGAPRSGRSARCSRRCCTARLRCCDPSRCSSAPRRCARSGSPRW